MPQSNNNDKSANGDDEEKESDEDEFEPYEPEHLVSSQKMANDLKRKYKIGTTIADLNVEGISTVSLIRFA